MEQRRVDRARRRKPQNKKEPYTVGRGGGSGGRGTAAGPAGRPAAAEDRRTCGGSKTRRSGEGGRPGEGGEVDEDEEQEQEEGAAAVEGRVHAEPINRGRKKPER